MLTVDIEKALGEFSLQAAFTAESGCTVLFGPSGAGKTSIITMIAGLARPDRGRIVLDGETLFDADKRIAVPASRRHLGLVFQEGRLFPHLSVKHNLDYGRWMNGHAFDAAAFDHVVSMLDIGHLLARRPGRLSGGERQRVAIGRALLMQPRLLLLDEPLASLDTARKAEILPYLERLRDEARVPMIYVSHSPDEVKRIASRVVMLEAGRVTAVNGAELLSA
ncbi:MAG TPA: molybdenum ABC transporter ATP-binding protein [Pseudolabrys sp.]|jgi:molybdate transport system ATP-binding protein|nr:molybdenum ABC transporter ATP-binding protein [Pseudolabrys sp.]